MKTLSSDDCARLVRTLLPDNFRANGHQLADSPHATVRIRNLDHETYLRIDAPRLGLADDSAAAETAFTESLRAEVQAIVDSLNQ